MARSDTLARITDNDDRLLQIAFDVLATYRLTTLMKDDKITEDIRNLVFKKYGEPSESDAHKLSYLLACPWCLSVYFGAAVATGLEAGVEGVVLLGPHRPALGGKELKKVPLAS